jgi:hypothetical protein
MTFPKTSRQSLKKNFEPLPLRTFEPSKKTTFQF